MCARSRWFHSPAASPRPLAERAAALSSDQAARKTLRRDATTEPPGPVTGVLGVGAIADPPSDRSDASTTDLELVVPTSAAARLRKYSGLASRRYHEISMDTLAEHPGSRASRSTVVGRRRPPSSPPRLEPGRSAHNR